MDFEYPAFCHSSSDWRIAMHDVAIFLMDLFRGNVYLVNGFLSALLVVCILSCAMIFVIYVQDQVWKWLVSLVFFTIAVSFLSMTMDAVREIHIYRTVQETRKQIENHRREQLQDSTFANHYMCVASDILAGNSVYMLCGGHDTDEQYLLKVTDTEFFDNK